MTVRDDELAAREREILAQGQRLLDTAALLHSMTDVCARLRRNLDGASFARRRELVERQARRGNLGGSLVVNAHELGHIRVDLSLTVQARGCDAMMAVLDVVAKANLEDGDRRQRHVPPSSTQHAPEALVAVGAGADRTSTSEVSVRERTDGVARAEEGREQGLEISRWDANAFVGDAQHHQVARFASHPTGGVLPDYLKGW